MKIKKQHQQKNDENEQWNPYSQTFQRNKKQKKQFNWCITSTTICIEIISQYVAETCNKIRTRAKSVKKQRPNQTKNIKNIKKCGKHDRDGEKNISKQQQQRNK